MLTAVLSLFVLAVATPAVHRAFRGSAGWTLGLLPLIIFVYFGTLIDVVTAGQSVTSSYRWVPSAGVELSFHLDGLSLLFAMVVTGIGALVLVYAAAYFAGDARLPRLHMFLLAFMGSMLGLVLADDVITLFVFWELTGITSYLLIGFDHERPAARSAALQALLVTTIGGMALLAGLTMLAITGGSWQLTDLTLHFASAVPGEAAASTLAANAMYSPILVLLLLAAFTKSAQFPFHFWLPGAMEAPAPVSAYLHSATMVKAGVYLLARLSPIMGGTDQWYAAVGGVGALTMVVGAVLAVAHTDLKRILAYTTVSVLGTLVMLIGIGSERAVQAAIVFLLVHALYKGALFLTIGAVDHETGERDVDRLGGMARAMPATAFATTLAALSMAGMPLFLGFIGKELVYDALTRSPFGSLLVTAAIVTNVILVALAGVLTIRVFFGRRRLSATPHEAPLGMWLGPMILAGLGLVIGVAPRLFDRVASAATAAVRGAPSVVHLELWHGLSLVFQLSVFTLATGLAVFAVYPTVRHLATTANRTSRWGPQRWYTGSINSVLAFAELQTRVLQNGHLRFYLMVIFATTLGLVGLTLATRVGPLWLSLPTNIRPYEAITAALILCAAVGAVHSRSRLAAVAALGVVGFGIALVYILFGAPDLAKTQFAVETLTVVLFVLVLYRLPRYARYSAPLARVRDAAVALAAGGLMTTLTLAVVALPRVSRVSGYYAENSVSLAHGRNIVNVIIVDFRGLDTLGEITVLSVAATGVFALLRLRPRTHHDDDASRDSAERGTQSDSTL
jgi:multicomponent Na+:H+ antiporter subunit A